DQPRRVRVQPLRRLAARRARSQAALTVEGPNRLTVGGLIDTTTSVCPRRKPTNLRRFPAQPVIQEAGMAYVIAEPCINVKDKACVEVCPVDCIYEGQDMLYIHPDECIDCGACEPVCPVKAIFAEDETPANWKNFIELNKQFFKDNPGVKPATKA